MTKQRADLGFGNILDDLASFEPKVKPKQHPEFASSKQKQAAEAAGFKSREPEKPKEKKQLRRRRTGRNAQINIKTTPETIELFTSIADKNGWGLGETFEKAIALLEK